MRKQWANQALSLTSLRLLVNLGTIRDNLNTLGLDWAVELEDRYLAHLSAKQLCLLDLLDYITACITHIYRITPEQHRAFVFKDYQPAEAPWPDQVYAPKAEVRHFCERIEPMILASQRIAQQLGSRSREEDDVHRV